MKHRKLLCAVQVRPIFHAFLNRLQICVTQGVKVLIATLQCNVRNASMCAQQKSATIIHEVTPKSWTLN